MRTRDRTGSSRPVSCRPRRRPRHRHPRRAPPRAPARRPDRPDPVTTTYLERLAARTSATGTVLCLGLDPDLDALPAGFTRDLRGLERFATLVAEAAGPVAAAIKPNLAFFEAFGSAGMAALERIRSSLPSDL